MTPFLSAEMKYAKIYIRDVHCILITVFISMESGTYCIVRVITAQSKKPRSINSGGAATLHITFIKFSIYTLAEILLLGVVVSHSSGPLN